MNYGRGAGKAPLLLFYRLPLMIRQSLPIRLYIKQKPL